MVIHEVSLYLLWPITSISFNVPLNGQGICNCLCFVEASVRFCSLPSTRQLRSLKRPSQSFARTALLTEHERHNFSLKMTSGNSWFRLASWWCTLVAIYYSGLKFCLARKPACCLAGGVHSARLSQNCSCRLNTLPSTRDDGGPKREGMNIRKYGGTLQRGFCVSCVSTWRFPGTLELRNRLNSHCKLFSVNWEKFQIF